MNKDELNIHNKYNMFNQILIANTGYTNGKKIYNIDCNNLSQGDINYEYTNIVLTDKIELPYELIGKEGQQIKPSFDCDPKRDKNGEIDILKTIQEGVKEVDKLYPDNKKYAYYRLYDTDDNKVKISSHIIVDGIRTNSKTILHKLESNNYKKNEPFDHSIYSLNRGLYPCFTNKKAKGWDKQKEKFIIFYTKTFIPICLETGKDLKWADIDIRKYCASYVEESFVMDFIEPPRGPIEPKEEKIQYDDDDKNHNGLNLEEIIKHLKIERAEDRDDWLNGIFCVINCAENLGMSKKKQKDIAHLFSSICPSKYEEDLVDDWLAINFDKKRNYGYRWKFILDWLKQDDPEYYNSIINVKKNVLMSYADTKKEHEKRYKKIMFPPVIFDEKRGAFDSIEKSTKSFGHLKYVEEIQKPTPDGQMITIYKQRNFFSEWLNDPYIEVYEQMKWLPNKPVSKKGDDILNTWTGWEIENEILENWDTFNDNPDNDYWEWFKEFSVNLWGGEEISNYILATFASKIQNPAKRVQICSIFYGKQGLGKSSFIEIIQAIFGKYFIGLESAKQIYADHSMCEVNKLIVCVNETKGGDNHKNSNILKTRITENTLYVNPKGIQAYEEQNYAEYIMPTNNLNVVDYSDESKRRFYQVEATNYYCPVRNPEKVEWWNEFKELQQDRRVIRQIFEGFKKFDVKAIIPSGNFQDEKYKPETSITKDVKFLNRCKILHFLHELVDMVQDHLDGIDCDKDILNLIQEKNSGGELITTNNKLFECFDVWCKKSKINFEMNKIVFGRKIKKYADDLPSGVIRKDTNSKTHIHRDGFLEYIHSL